LLRLANDLAEHRKHGRRFLEPDRASLLGPLNVFAGSLRAVDLEQVRIGADQQSAFDGNRSR
jgi:hypothetical protein